MVRECQSGFDIYWYLIGSCHLYDKSWGDGFLIYKVRVQNVPFAIGVADVKSTLQ